MEFAINPLYCSHFCEENVWHLCSRFIASQGKEGEAKCEKETVNGYAIFITSTSKATPICNQRAASTRTEPVLWDYHVIFLLKKHGYNSLIFDLDTTMDFPTDASEYCRSSFKMEKMFPPQHRQIFRVVTAQEFVDNFASDRSHMKDSGLPYPAWPLIKGSKATTSMNLFELFVDVETEQSDKIGKIMEREQFLHFCLQTNDSC